jgi:EAL domain-containing protein (putative c-di-GMP-specific phosphodiesterase class I)
MLITNVTHITLSKATNTKPCLEYFSDGHGEPRRVTIEQCPFRIGRAETADLRVESVQVSREHAEIFERHGMWLVRDLGSTNGTHVNGKQVKETLLSDGDILQVAETELTFIASAASQFQRMVTQPTQSKKLAGASNAIPPEVSAARMLIEATLQQVIPTQVFAANSLRLGTTDALFSSTHRLPRLQSALDQSQLLGERYRELERRQALEAALECNNVNRLYLAVSRAEIESPQRLFSSLKQLRGRAPRSWELGITISLPTDIDILRITELYGEAQEHDLRIAFDDFQGNGAQVLHLKSVLPDFLVLSASMMNNLSTARQPMRRLESLLAACDELAIKPVLPRSDCEHTIAQCQEIGFDLVLAPCHAGAASSCAELSLTV